VTSADTAPPNSTPLIRAADLIVILGTFSPVDTEAESWSG
jgi:hypothetical protein